MKRLGAILLALNLLSSLAFAQGDDKDDDPSDKPSEDVTLEKSETKVDDEAGVLAAWEKTNGNLNLKAGAARKWLFLQEQAGAYGALSPLVIDTLAFESYGWLQMAEADGIRLYLQLNPDFRKDKIAPDELGARLKRYADLSYADGVVLKTASGGWALYIASKGMSLPAVKFDKGPETLRQDQAARWLVQQLGYDAIVVGTAGDYLVLAKLRSLKVGGQGLILKKSTTSVTADSEKDIGALLRVSYQDNDFALAKVSLAKSGRPKVPVGAKVIFDAP